MLVFPQLTTGTISQYPLKLNRSTYLLRNELADGATVNWVDAAPKTNHWNLALRDLTDLEAEAVQNLFQAAEGRLGVFTLLDPTANLLAYSEEYDKPCWISGPALQRTTGIDDPFGGRHAVRLINAGQAEQTLSQTLAAPAWFTYSFSVYARSAGGSTLSLRRTSGSASQSRSATAGPTWMRWTVAGALDTADESITFSVALPAGASVDLYGIQAEPQPGPSAYKLTGARNGVYSSARFDSDALDMTSDGPNQNRYNLRIVARD